jgi:16S rRNA (guanine527-N7)-methyltransferase
MSTAWRPEMFGSAEFESVSPVSRETMERLKTYVATLSQWNSQINLVSPKSLTDVWRRHVWDSAQLLDHISKNAATLVDLGSGAGFPGLVLAIIVAEKRPNFRVVLYESIAKKCRFLETVLRSTGIHAEIRNARIEDAPHEPFDVVTARACATLAQLLSYSVPFQSKLTQCLFLKGQSFAAELEEAHRYWTMSVEQHASRSDSSGVILSIRDLRHAPGQR